jgi:hypothetical protein
MKAENINYAVALAYLNNSNMYECVKYVRREFPEFDIFDDEKIEELWDAIDAYVDIST